MVFNLFIKGGANGHFIHISNLNCFYGFDLKGNVEQLHDWTCSSALEWELNYFYYGIFQVCKQPIAIEYNYYLSTSIEIDSSKMSCQWIRLHNKTPKLSCHVN
jgi:hypothetical protein